MQKVNWGEEQPQVPQFSCRKLLSSVARCVPGQPHSTGQRRREEHTQIVNFWGVSVPRSRRGQ